MRRAPVTDVAHLFGRANRSGAWVSSCGWGLGGGGKGRGEDGRGEDGRGDGARHRPAGGARRRPIAESTGQVSADRRAYQRSWSTVSGENVKGEASAKPSRSTDCLTVACQTYVVGVLVCLVRHTQVWPATSIGVWRCTKTCQARVPSPRCCQQRDGALTGGGGGYPTLRVYRAGPLSLSWAGDVR